MEAQYIVLEYCPNLTSQKSRAVAVVAMKRIETSEAPLVLIRDAGWEQGILEEDQEYLQAVFDDLESLNLEDSRAAFAELRTMSAGLLRTGAEGTCQETQLHELLAQTTQTTKQGF